MALDASLAEGAGAQGSGRRLRALSFAGELQEQVDAGVGVGGPAASLGVPALSRYRLRFDLARDRLFIGVQKGPPVRSGGP